MVADGSLQESCSGADQEESRRRSIYRGAGARTAEARAVSIEDGAFNATV